MVWFVLIRFIYELLEIYYMVMEMIKLINEFEVVKNGIL